MGLCSSCCQPEKSKYIAVGEDGDNFHDDPGLTFKKEWKEFDMKSSVFEGAQIPRKLSRHSEYESRFIWINLEARTIHVSQHSNKDRRHKEASLADVTSIIRGSPKLEDTDVVKPSLGLTINFQKGGGIDLRFASDEECELWHTVLSRIITLVKGSV